jgi:hypothetical protein
MCNERWDIMKNKNLIKINCEESNVHTNIVADDASKWDLIDPFQPKEVYQHLFMDST